MWRSCARSRAAAFSLSLVLFFWFGWEIHQSVSHTLALLAAVLALFIAALAYAERPTAARAFLLGLIIGLGLMAKWSFLLVLLSLAAALAITPETRRMYREPRTLLVLAGSSPGGSQGRRHRRPCCLRRWRSGSQASPRS
ncbi:MAG: glycosyltransferase family 39 protein [Methyloceanibacter sp.]